MTEYILGQGFGYGYAVGLGAAFALIMISISKILAVYMNQKQHSERFTTAGRGVGAGMISSACVSSWTWPATLLSSTTWNYTYGLSGGYLYGIGGTIQLVLFLFLAIQMKIVAPGVHTIAELVRVRFGKHAHWVYLSYCMATNVLISSLLLLGGSQGFNATCGMHIVAASFLLPLGVCIYTLFGGLSATFISDWIHTVIIYAIILVMCFVTFCSSSIIGSTDKMYELLEAAQEKFPSATGKNYLSFDDPTMMELTWTVMISGIASIFADPSYGQKAIAADAKGVFQGYIMGGICWLAIPWALGTCGGLTARALLTLPESFTYPNALSDAEVSAGLPLIYAMGTILGKSGAAAGLLMLFMSVTSATSAELIAFSSIATYDVYRSYINPDATGKQLVKVTHYGVVGFSLFMAVIAVIFNYIGVTVGWLLSFTGIIVSPAVFTIVLTLFWSKLSAKAIIISCPLGTLSGIACWVGATAAYYPVIDKDTVSNSKPCLIGNFVSLFSTLFFLVIFSYVFPQEKFDFSTLSTAFIAGDDADEQEEANMHTSEEQKRTLKKYSFYCMILNVILLFGAYIIMPVSLLGSGYTFSKTYFRQWVVIIMIWVFASAMYVVIMPVYQGRDSFRQLFNAIFRGIETDYQHSIHTTQSAADVKAAQVVDDKEQAQVTAKSDQESA